MPVNMPGCGVGFAGGILNNGNLTLFNNKVNGNSATLGGGIENEEVLTTTNSTISGNQADFGGGIHHDHLGYCR
jgi:hypothetical protein